VCPRVKRKASHEGEEELVPTYVYERPDGSRFEIRQGFNDANLTEDPETGVPLRRVFTAPPVIFKGSGWYKTDSRATSGKADVTSEPAKTEKPDEAAGATKSEGAEGAAKSETPAAKAETGANTAEAKPAAKPETPGGAEKPAKPAAPAAT